MNKWSKFLMQKQFMVKKKLMVVKCLSESTQMGKYSRKFENKIAEIFEKSIVYM